MRLLAERETQGAYTHAHSQDAPLVLYVHQSYSKGQKQPEVFSSLSGAPIVSGQGITIPVGSDRTQLLVHYAPSIEDGEACEHVEPAVSQSHRLKVSSQPSGVTDLRCGKICSPAR